MKGTYKDFYSAAEVLMGMMEKGNTPLSEWYWQAQIQRYWQEILPPSWRSITQVLGKDRGGVLLVAVSHGVGLYELNFCKPDLLAKLREVLGEQAPRDIRWIQGGPQANSEGGSHATLSSGA
jgi:hypothetical protein